MEPRRHIDPPEMTKLGKGRPSQDAIRRHAQERNIPPDQIEAFLDEIKLRRAHHLYFSIIEALRPARWLLLTMLLVILGFALFETLMRILLG
jgi:hypothetical protein